MGAWLDLEARDIAAFLVTGIIGFVLAGMLPPGPWMAFVPILCAYHLFLLWLVLTQENHAKVVLPVFSTILTHAAFMAAVVAIGMDHGHIPYFRFLRFGVAGLALFERTWLFSGTENKPREEEIETQTASIDAIRGTAEDYQDWLDHLAANKGMLSRPGTSVRVEYQKWMMRRVAGRPVVSSGNSAVAGD